MLRHTIARSELPSTAPRAAAPPPSSRAGRGAVGGAGATGQRVVNSHRLPLLGVERGHAAAKNADTREALTHEFRDREGDELGRHAGAASGGDGRPRGDEGEAAAALGADGQQLMPCALARFRLREHLGREMEGQCEMGGVELALSAGAHTTGEPMTASR